MKPLAAVLLLSASLSFAEEAEPPSALQAHSNDFLLNEVLELKPTAGHHFEPKARQRCGSEKPFELTPRVFRCQLTKAGAVKVTASVCEDSGKMCLPETFVVQVAGAAGASAALPNAENKGGGLGPLSGFLTNEPKKALAQARSEGKLLYIHFGAIWCPYCNMLEELAYPAAEFQAASADMIRLRLDADSDVSWDWKSRFKIGGYPTIIVADAKLREIGRIVGYRPAPVLAKRLAEFATLKDQPVERSRDKKRLGLWHFERGEFDQAAKLLAGLKDAEAHRYGLLAEKKLAEQEGRLDDMKTALRSLVDDFPADVELSSWLDELLEADKPFAEKRLEQAESAADAWAVDPKLYEADATPGDMYEGIADLLDDAGRKQDAVPYYAKAAQAFATMASSSTLKLSRGPNIERAYCLGKAGKTAEARALYESLIAAYPDEFTFHRGYAELLSEGGENEKAYEQAKLAVADGYGDNWLRAVHLQAKLELALGRKEDARRTLDLALAEAVLPPSTAVRTHRYVAQLRALRAQLN